MSDKKLAELISKMAHELRSPLTSVKGFSAMLVNRWDRFDDTQRFEFVETIHADAERMGRIVSEILDLARLEAGKLELQRTSVSVRPVLDAAAARHSELPGSDRVDIDADGDVTVFADADRLEGVVSTLIENAVKFSDEGPIAVGAHRLEGGGVRIVVADRGIGIPEEHLADIFAGPGPASNVSAPSGIGLGLYLGKGLIEAHGGSISVESRVGQGSVFTVTIPLEGSADE